MAIELSRGDHQIVRRVLCAEPEWSHVRGRVQLLRTAFAGAPDRSRLLGLLDLDGDPAMAADAAIGRLATFGQLELGKESLGVLLNCLLDRMGGGEDADALTTILERYPFEVPAVHTRGLPRERWRGSDSNEEVFEKIIGENTLRHLYVLERLIMLARSVCQIRGRQTGTGFLLGPGLVLTNHHVVPTEDAARACSFVFGYRLDAEGREPPLAGLHASRFRDGGVFVTSPAGSAVHPDALDYTLLRVDTPPHETAPLSLSTAAPALGERVTIIQHAEGRPLQVSNQNNFVEYVDRLLVQYTTSTLPGSSGSPVLNEDGEVVALHHAGGMMREPATGRRYYRNQGIRMSAVLDDLKRRHPDARAQLDV